MKSCPTCNRTYADESLTYCLADGSLLSAPYDPEATQRISPSRVTNAPTEVLPSSPPHSDVAKFNRNPLPTYIIITLLALIVGGGIVALLRSGARDTSTSEPSASKSSNVQNTSSTSPANTSKRNSEAEAKPTPTKVPDRTINYPSTRTGWYPIGSGKFRLEVSGEINIGGNVILTPQGWSKLGDNTAFVPGLPFGGLIAKIGNGTPFLVGYSADFDTQEQVYIAINDSTYSDNTGSFTVHIIGQ